MTKAIAFLKRDLQIQTSYRVGFILQLASGSLSIASYYFFSQFIGKSVDTQLLQYRGDYFSFLLVGLVLNEFSSVSLRVFSETIRESQLSGNLEALLSTPTSLNTVILLSGIYPLLWTSINVLLYVVLSMTLFGLNLTGANWLAASCILGLMVLISGGIGIISASFVLVFKRGNPFPWIMDNVAWLFGGVLYPITVLPHPLRAISAFVPIRYAIDGMRGAVLEQAAWSQLWSSFVPLSIFALVIVPIGFATFQFANKHVRRVGSLAEY